MEEALRAMLLAVAPVHWGMAPQGSLRPFVVLNRVDAVRGYSHQGKDANVAARVQADIYGSTYAVTRLLARRLIAEISGRRAGVISAVFVDDDRDFPTADEGMAPSYRTSVDLIIHYQE